MRFPRIFITNSAVHGIPEISIGEEAWGTLPDGSREEFLHLPRAPDSHREGFPCSHAKADLSRGVPFLGERNKGLLEARECLGSSRGMWGGRRGWDRRNPILWDLGLASRNSHEIGRGRSWSSGISALLPVIPLGSGKGGSGSSGILELLAILPMGLGMEDPNPLGS